MTETRMGLIRVLGYSGLLPFILALMMQFLDKQVLTVQAVAVFSTYSAVILSFLSGALWGRGLFLTCDKRARLLLACSNIFALLAWLALLLHAERPPLLLLCAGFVAVFAIEWYQREGLAVTYFRLRLHLTTTVVAFHLLMLSIL